MTDEQTSRKRGRPRGALNATTRAKHRALREIVTPQEYVDVIKGLLDMALAADNEKTRLAAIKEIINRVEGLPVQLIEQTNRCDNDTLAAAMEVFRERRNHTYRGDKNNAYEYIEDDDDEDPS